MRQVKIYVSKHCASCEEVQSFFAEKKVKFNIIDVTYDETDFNQMVKNGGIATPFIMIGKQRFHSFDRTKMEEVLNHDDE